MKSSKYKTWSFLLLITFSVINSLAGNLKNIADKSDVPTITIDIPYLEHWSRQRADTSELDKENYKISSFSRLKNGEEQFSYYLLEQFKLDSNYQTCLIYEYYQSERAVWLVNYSLGKNVIDAIEIFYDNDEGAWQTTSTINKKEKIVLLTEYDAYSIPEIKTQKVRVLSNGKFEK